MNWLHENAVDLIGHALTFVGIMLAAVTVVWQMRRQHRSSLDLQRDTAREALKLRIYETLVQKIRTLSDANIDASMYVFSIPYAIENFQREQAAGYQPSPLKQRVPEFIALHTKAANELAELIGEFEAWSIAFPGLHVFTVALHAAGHDAREAFPPLFSALLPILPMDAPQGETGKPAIIHPPPAPETLMALKILIDGYKEAIDEIGCYLIDLTAEAQNSLLYGLFPQKVPQRKPLDPRQKVISTDPQKAQELIRYFETSTPWGRNQASINAEVIAEVQARAATNR